MKILIGIPVIYCKECVQQCLDSLNGQNADILIIDNNATLDIKKIIVNFKKIENERNIYVNPAWNQIMENFLNSDYDTLIILNSDMVLSKDAIRKIQEIEIDTEQSIILPNISDHHISNGIREIEWGFPGVMIVLTKKMAKLVYPIPETLKIWFGDDWIYKRLIKHGYKLRVYYSIKASHSGSRSISALKEAGEIIELDKINWLNEEKKI